MGFKSQGQAFMEDVVSGINFSGEEALIAVRLNADVSPANTI